MRCTLEINAYILVHSVHCTVHTIEQNTLRRVLVRGAARRGTLVVNVLNLYIPYVQKTKLFFHAYLLQQFNRL